MQQRTTIPNANAVFRRVAQLRYAAQPSRSGSRDNTDAFAISVTPQSKPYPIQSRARALSASLNVAQIIVATSSAVSDWSQRLWKLNRIAFGKIAQSHAAPAA